MFVHHVEYLPWRIWSQIKSFQKWKMTYNSKFPNLASFWSTFNLTCQCQRSFKWIFGEHESWRYFSSLFKKSYFMIIWWMVKKIWPNDHNVYMEVQHAITFDPKLQNESLFLHIASHDLYFPNLSLHCMKKYHMIIWPCMCFLEGKWRI